MYKASINDTDWFPSWCEAAYPLGNESMLEKTIIFIHLVIVGDSLRILTSFNTSNQSTVDEHLLRLTVLSNQTITLSRYVSISISSMTNQIRAIRFYVQGAFDACLNELQNATGREITLLPDNNSPYLIFARSSELLALHLLLIHQKRQKVLQVCLLLPAFSIDCCIVFKSIRFHWNEIPFHPFLNI